MPRRCSHCSNNGHNSRTCPSRGVGGGGGLRLFGVTITDDGSIIKKSASMGSISSHYHYSSSSNSASPNPGSPCFDPARELEGYLSDDPAHASSSANRRGERKKGVPWTEEEHRLFLIGLQKLGRGDWRGIARSFVMSRTPTQVASHAQKYFIRQSSAIRKKRRSSLFDMVTDMALDSPAVQGEQVLQLSSENTQSGSAKSLRSLNLSLKSEFEHVETTSQEIVGESKETMMRSSRLSPLAPGFFHPYVPYPFSLWPSGPFEEFKGAETSHHQVLKPIQIISKEPVNLDELVRISHLSFGETQVREPSPLSFKLLGESSRQLAFHANAPVGGSDLSNGKNSIIQAV